MTTDVGDAIATRPAAQQLIHGQRHVTVGGAPTAAKEAGRNGHDEGVGRAAGRHASRRRWAPRVLLLDTTRTAGGTR